MIDKIIAAVASCLVGKGIKMIGDLLTLVEQDGFRAVRKSVSRGGQLNGPCPFCGGTDRFRIQPNQGSYGWFACNQCQRKGNAVDYLMLKRGMPKMEALAAVGWTPRDGSTLQFAHHKYAYDERPQWNEPTVQWQEAAASFYQDCQRILLRSTQGQEALAYLKQRGLTEKTIKAAGLGYHPRETYGMAKEWGKTVKLSQGIVMPWFIEGKIWRITVRDERVINGEGRYRQIGGGSNGLYLADSLTLNRSIAVLVEGEIDALSLAQECGDLAAVVATGTTQGSHTLRWISLLARQERVLIAFDAEDKGDTAAKWWMTRLDNAQRLRPWGKDANQMLQDGADLQQWLTSYKALAQKITIPAPEIANVHFQPVDDGIASICSICGSEVEVFSEQGIAFCNMCWLEQGKEPESGTVQEQPILTMPLSDLERLEQFAIAVSRVASVFPGKCKITKLPLNTTLAQWVALQPHVYTPCLLPRLPRKQCPALRLIERQTQVPHTKQTYREPRLIPCKQKPLANGWCEEHQLAQTMLDLGVIVDYPALQFNQYRGVDEGKATWEEYVVRISRKHLQHDIQYVKALIQRTAQKV